MCFMRLARELRCCGCVATKQQPHRPTVVPRPPSVTTALSRHAQQHAAAKSLYRKQTQLLVRCYHVTIFPSPDHRDSQSARVER